MNLSTTRSQSTSVLSTIAAGWRHLRVMFRPDHIGGPITSADPPAAPPPPALVLGVIDDPERLFRLLSVRGALTADSITSLADAFAEVPNCAMLHLDLTDAALADASVIARLGALIDALEDRTVRIRIVGLGRLASVRLD
jgi:hypothetical protein